MNQCRCTLQYLQLITGRYSDRLLLILFILQLSMHFVCLFLAFVDGTVVFIMYCFRGRFALLNFIFVATSNSVVLVQELGSGCKEYLLWMCVRSLDIVIVAISCR